MAIAAGFAYGVAFPKLYSAGDAAATSRAVDAHAALTATMLAAWLVVIALDVALSWLLYAYFKRSRPRAALWAGSLRIIYTAGLAAAVGALAIGIAGGGRLAGFERFLQLWTIALIVFGAHLIVVALASAGSRVPGWIRVVIAAAGIAYVCVSLAQLFGGREAGWVTTLNDVLAAPMAAGELLLALWLLVKGGRS